jgi:hypothetical protein
MLAYHPKEISERMKNTREKGDGQVDLVPDTNE